MSSFLGHSLVAYSLASASQYRAAVSHRLVWIAWLIVLASAPDVDYLVPALNSAAHAGIRITHSIAFSLILPLCTAAVLWITIRDGQKLRSLAVYAALAGLSHLVLDFLVGVTPLPLFWPFSTATFAAPAGILPSAGRIQLSNYYFYRNIFIEIGILAPILYLLRGVYCGTIGIQNRTKVFALLLIAAGFIFWSVSLSR